LLTYRSFCTATDLLESLFERFKGPAKESTGATNTMKHIRLRVWFVLKTWLEIQFYDFEMDGTLLVKLTTFIDQVCAREMETPAAQLRSIVHRKLLGTDVPRQPIMVRSPKPLLPYRKTGPLKLLDIPPVEFARQITLYEHAIFSKIKAHECLQPTSVSAVNLKMLIAIFNKMSAWSVTTIVTTTNVASRAELIEYFIKVATECKKLQNYNGMMEFVSGLQSAPVSRLKRSWSSIKAKKLQALDDFSNMMVSNYKVLRSMLELSAPPCLPYIGVFMTDLTFIQENADFVYNNLINFEKRYMVASVIAKIQQNQQKPFSFIVVSEIQEFIANISDGGLDQKEAYRHSLQIEPREVVNKELRSETQ